MKKFAVFLISFFLVAHCLGAEENQQEVPVPNPLNLEKNWWAYFDVPENLLSERILTFKKELRPLKLSLDQKNHKKIFELIKLITYKLDLLAKQNKLLAPSEPQPLQFLKEYTLAQLLQVNERLMQSEKEISQLTSKMNARAISLDRTQVESDQLIIYYQTLTPTSYERLLYGLKIIDTRINSALQSVEIEQLEKRLHYFTKNRQLLNEELENAKNRLTFATLSREELDKEREEAKNRVNEENEKLIELETKQSKMTEDSLQDAVECCLSDFHLFSQRAKIENLTIMAIIEQFKLILFDMLHNQSGGRQEEIQKILNRSYKNLTNAKKYHSQSLKQIEEDRARAGQLVANAIKENNQEILSNNQAIASIHLELDSTLATLEHLSLNAAHGILLHNMADSLVAERKGFTENWINQAEFLGASIWRKIQKLMDTTLIHIKDQPITIDMFIKSIIIVIAGVIISKYLRVILIKRKIIVHAFSRSTEYIVLRFIHYGIILISLILAFVVFGLDFTNIAIIAGALGVGIGFGLQSLVSNILSGFTLLLKRFLKVGDLIEIENGVKGRVIAINLQETILETSDGANLVVPNAQLTGKQLTNWTMYSSCRRIKVPFSTDYGLDKDKIKSTVLERIKNLPYIVSEKELYPIPDVRLVRSGKITMNYELVVWIDLNHKIPQGTPESNLLWEIDSALKNYSE